jgi:hypothetical protein
MRTPDGSCEVAHAFPQSCTLRRTIWLGDWEFTAVSKEWGKMRGLWSAARLVEGQILDEYRIVGDKGETIYVTTTVRAYNAVLDRWELIGMDEGNGLNDVGTARRVGSEMHIEQKFGVMSPK